MDSKQLLSSTAQVVSAQESPSHYHFGSGTSWKLQDQAAHTFWQNYTNSIFDPNFVHYIGEYQGDYVPIVFIGYFNFQFDAQQDHIDDYLALGTNKQFITDIVTNLQKVVYETYSVGDPISSNTLTTIVTETVTVDVQQKIYTVALRIQMPCMTVARFSQDQYVRQPFIRALRDSNVLRHLEVSPLGDLETIFQPNQSGTPIPMFRSTIFARHQILQTERVVTVACYSVGEDELDETTVGHMGIHPASHQHFQKPQLFDYNSMSTHKDEDDLIFILSVNYLNGELRRLRNNNIAETPAVLKRSTDIDFEPTGHYLGEYRILGNPEDVACIFMGMLNNRRANDISSLIAICQALNTIFEQQSETGLQLLKEFAGRGNLWSEYDCEDYYEHNPDENKSLRTLGWMALKDNPSMYDDWLRREYAQIHEDMAQCTDLKVAMGIYTFYWLQIITCEGSTKMTRAPQRWYLYKQDRHMWIDDHCKVAFTTILQSDFRKRVCNLRTLASQRSATITDKKESTANEELISGYAKLIAKLETEHFLNSIIKTCYRLFHMPSFENIKDRNPFILGCRNGVIETTETTATFRVGRPDDYNTKSTGVRYPLHVNPNDPVYKAMHYWIKQLFYHDEDVEAEWDSNARLLRGRNFMKVFEMWIGLLGNEGKSSYKRLQEYAFHNYTFTPPTTMFTGDRSQSGNATPELVPAMLCRVIYGQEASRREGKFNDGQIKMLTGDDAIYYRSFMTLGEAELPLFKTIYIGNRPLGMYEADEALRTRTIIKMFNSRWTSDAPTDVQEQWRTRIFPKDPNFDKLIKRMPPYFLWECVQCFPRAMRRGIKLTKTQKKAAAEYWEKFDIYHQYTKNNIEIINNDAGQPDQNVILTVDALFNSFSQWLQRSYPDALGPMTRGDARMEFEIRVLGPADDKIDGWYGKRLKGGRGGHATHGGMEEPDQQYWG